MKKLKEINTALFFIGLILILSNIVSLYSSGTINLTLILGLLAVSGKIYEVIPSRVPILETETQKELFEQINSCIRRNDYNVYGKSINVLAELRVSNELTLFYSPLRGPYLLTKEKAGKKKTHPILIFTDDTPVPVRPLINLSSPRIIRLIKENIRIGSPLLEKFTDGYCEELESLTIGKVLKEARRKRISNKLKEIQ